MAWPLVMAAVVAACSYTQLVNGRLAAEDGALGVECTVRVHDPRLDLEDACGVQGSESYSIIAGPVPTGGGFRCRVSGNLDEVFEVRVRCPGYAPLNVPLPVESCAGSLFGGCDDIDMGTLTVRR
jgi:hypothetical protein